MYTHLDYLTDNAARLLERDIAEARHEITFADGNAHERLERRNRVWADESDLRRRILNVKYTGFETVDEYWNNILARRNGA